MKKKSFWYTLTYYNAIPLFLFGIALIIFRNYIFKAFCFITQVTEQSRFYSPLYYIVNIGLTALWFLITFGSYRDQHYKALTGRNYRKDRTKFHKTYSELVNFFSHNDKYKMDVEKLPMEDWHTADGVILCKSKDLTGNYRLVKRDSNANGNLIAFGLPGSGKSTTQAATTAIRFNTKLKKGGCGVFAISIKGDLLNFVHGKRTNIKVFTPDREEGSCHYDPLLGVEQMSWTERRVFAENMSIIICPDESGDNSAFFVGGARDYLAAVILYLLHLHDSGQRDGALKFPEIIDMILQNNVFDLTLEIKNCNNTIPGEYSNGYIGSSEKNVSGIWSHLCKKIRPFNSGAIRTLFDGKGNCITPEDLNTGDVYIDVPQEKYQVYSSAMGLIISNFLMYEMAKKDVSSQADLVPHLYLLDEAVQLHLDFDKILGPAMMTLRSKKTSIFLLIQSIASLEACYGDAHAREIIDLCAYISVFNAQDPKSREYFQKLVGRRKMLKRSTSISTTDNKTDGTSNISINEVDEYIFESADFGDLTIRNGKKIIHQVLVYANGKYILGETTPCYE